MTRTTTVAPAMPTPAPAGRAEETRRARVAPLVPLVLAAVAGVVADRYEGGACGLSTSRWLIAAAAASAAGMVLARRRGVGVALLLAGWGALAGGWHHARWFDRAADDLARTASDVPRPAWVRGVVSDVLGVRPARGDEPDDAGLTRAVVELFATQRQGRWVPASGRALVSFPGDRTADVTAGEAIELVGALARPAPPLNPGEFDHAGYLHAQGIGLRLSIEDDDGLIAHGPPADPDARLAHWWRVPVFRVLGAVRRWSEERLARGLDPAALPLASALLLGRREAVDPEVNDAFARTGTTHLLAISGLHLQVLAAAVGYALRSLGLPRRGVFAAVAAAALGYAALVGLMPSVVRSVAMTAAICAAGAIDRRAASANTLALAGLLTLALNPASIFDAGCQLSFLAVAAIFWAVPPAVAWVRPEPDALTRAERYFQPRWRTLLRRAGARVVDGLVVSVVVWLVAAPLVLLKFHVASPIGILLNVPLIPLTSLALLMAGLSLGLSAAFGPLGVPAGLACSWLLRATEWFVRRGAEVRWGHAFGPSPSWRWVLAFYVGLGLTAVAWGLSWGKTARRLLAGATLATVPLGLMAMLGIGAPGRVEAEVLAVGHGSAVVLDLGAGRAALYDCGRMRDPSVGRRIVAPALWARGVWRVDTVILSHADADHYNGLPGLLERVGVGRVIVPPGFGDDPGAAQLLDHLGRRGVPVETAAAGDALDLGPFALRFLHPPRDWTAALATDNQRSLVVDLAPRRHAGAPTATPHAWLTGDLDGPGLAAVADGHDASGGGPVALVVAPHHGGRSANPPWFYERLGAGAVAVSQRRPLPGTSDALAAIEDRGLPVARTWQRGALRLQWDGAQIHMGGFLDASDAPRPRPGDNDG